MLEILLLTFALAPASTPAAASPAFAVDPGSAQCADAALAEVTSPVLALQGDFEEMTHCSATVDCGCGRTVSCSGHNKCRGVPRNCSEGVRGRVVCDGVATRCPPCDCQDGDKQVVPTGQCCSCSGSGGELREALECVNGCWETIGHLCGNPTPSCPVCQ